MGTPSKNYTFSCFLEITMTKDEKIFLSSPKIRSQKGFWILGLGLQQKKPFLFLDANGHPESTNRETYIHVIHNIHIIHILRYIYIIHIHICIYIYIYTHSPGPYPKPYSLSSRPSWEGSEV